MDSSGYSGDPACGRSPVQFRVCPNRMSCGDRAVERHVDTEGAFFSAVSAWSAGLAFRLSTHIAKTWPRRLTTLERTRVGDSSGLSQCNLGTEKKQVKGTLTSRLITSRSRAKPETRHPQDFILPTFPRRIGARKI